MSDALKSAVIAALIAACVALGLAAYGYRDRALRGELALASEQLSRSQENEARNRVALREAERVAALSSAHAAQQQENVHAYNEQKRLRAAADAAHRTADDQLRHLIASASAATGDRSGAEADAAACRSAGDRSKLLGGLLEEAVGLAREGEDLIEQRDSEVNFLLRTVHVGRDFSAE